MEPEPIVELHAFQASYWWTVTAIRYLQEPHIRSWTVLFEFYSYGGSSPPIIEALLYCIKINGKNSEGFSICCQGNINFVSYLWISLSFSLHQRYLNSMFHRLKLASTKYWIEGESQSLTLQNHHVRFAHWKDIPRERLEGWGCSYSSLEVKSFSR